MGGDLSWKIERGGPLVPVLPFPVPVGLVLVPVSQETVLALLDLVPVASDPVW